MTRILALVAVLVVGLTTASALADLCGKCIGMPVTEDLGTCKVCDGPTVSGLYPLCDTCSKKLNQCERCRGELGKDVSLLPASRPAQVQPQALDLKKDGTHTSGKWEYRYRITAAGTRSEGYHGELLYDGKALPEPGINDCYDTPWGRMYWVGKPVVMFGSHGWMLKRKPSAPEGKLLPEPSVSPAAVARLQVLTDSKPAGQAVEPTGWVKDEAAKHFGKPVWVYRDWMPVGGDEIVIHDTKMHGSLTVKAQRAPDGKTIIVTAGGSHTKHARLPDGANNLMSVTLDSVVAEPVTFYLAIEVPAAQAASQPAK